MAIVVEGVAKKESQRKLDSFSEYLDRLSGQLQNQINRVENVAIRFRGHTPKNESGDSKDMVKPPHKIDELELLANRIERQIKELSAYISDVEDI